MKWNIIDSGVASAESNMALDGRLLNSFIAGDQDPILHLYRWERPSATYGYFTNPYTFLDPLAVQKRGLELARRPTGGGVIFHLTDFAFSILIPAGNLNYSINTLENYAFINHFLIDILKELSGRQLDCHLLPHEPLPQDHHSAHFCMAKPTKYDIVASDGRKIAGAAQRRTKQGFLHQGTISFALPDESLLEAVLHSGTSVLQSMKLYTYPLLDILKLSLDQAQHGLHDLFLEHCSRS